MFIAYADLFDGHTSFISGESLDGGGTGEVGSGVGHLYILYCHIILIVRVRGQV